MTMTVADGHGVVGRTGDGAGPQVMLNWSLE
jgi:hypothetical protein